MMCVFFRLVLNVNPMIQNIVNIIVGLINKIDATLLCKYLKYRRYIAKCGIIPCIVVINCLLVKHRYV